MKNVTMTTEKLINEMIKNEAKYGNELQYLLNSMKSRLGYEGATIAEMKKYNEYVSNESQIDIVVTNVLRGINVNFNEYINVVDCLNLQYATIRDFNKLVKACYESN